MAMQKIYLAGPDVFLPDAVEIGRRKQALCREFDFIGLFPLDQAFPDVPSGTDIFRANCALMREADIGLFNLSPFRGPSADAGTVFELGLMVGLGKRVFGYRNNTALYHQRVPPGKSAGADPDGFAIEKFGLGDNLMIDCAITDSGGVISAVDEPSLAALAALRQALLVVWRQFYGVAAG
jgi:nucleoside 2-deoxyribosyltransferase